jgi:energy-coupling factor transporter ATP-binding protein EcfA2
MHIKRIAVASWRGLCCELNDLSRGLNLICGPNESGKSRLVQALRFALFESSSGRARYKRALETWGTVDGKPRVEVEFELAGANWLLEKTYLGSGCSTVLRGAGKSLEGEAAEARLADLMGVSPGGTTEMKSSERGIWSLLWVDQGESRERPIHNHAAQARLQDQLTAEIGDIAAGEVGQRILLRARAHKEQFYTAKTDGEKPVLRDARDRVRLAQARLDEAAALHAAVVDDADGLDELRRREADLRTRIAAAERHLAGISSRHGDAADAARLLEQCRGQLEVARLELAAHERSWQAHTELSADHERLDTEIVTLEQERVHAATAQQAAESAHTEATLAVAAADQALETASVELQHLRRCRKTAALRDERTALLNRLREADSLGGRIREIRARQVELAPISRDDVERLRAARQAVDAARARLEGASASLELLAHRSLEIDGVGFAPGESHTLLIEDERRVEVDGVLSLIIRPGGGELARLRDALADAEGELAAALASLAVGDIADAERTYQTRRDLDAELGRLREALSLQLPEGRDEIEARMHEIQLQLDGTGDAASAPFDAHALEGAEDRERRLAGERDALRTRRDIRAADLATARDRASDLEVQLQEKRRQAAVAAARIAARPAEAVLRGALDEASRTWTERVAARDRAQGTYDALGGEALGLQLQQAEQAVRLLRDEHNAAQAACIRLEGRLESAGDDARHERVLDLQAEVMQARAELDRLVREASAARRLYDVLDEQYRSARERLTVPVMNRIRPYLSELFPDAEAWLDDDLNLLGLRSPRADAAFDALSGGAREQLSLLVRIGLAEVVGAQESWPLILDDVLVNTDAERIRRVQRLLFQAAKNMQILLFTCHGPLFDLLGPDRRIDLAASSRPPKQRSLS